MNGIDWATARLELTSMAPGAETDERIESWVRAALQSTCLESVETGTLLNALELADHAIVKQRVAFAIAAIASDEDDVAVDTLKTALDANSDDEFLYVEIFKALGLLAKRNAYAELPVLGIIYRLKDTDSSFALIAAAKIIGQFVTVQDNLKLRKKLDEISYASDLDVQAEVFYQQALIGFTDAMLAGTLTDLEERLQSTRRLFLRAEASAEQREDATAFVLLLDLILECFHLSESTRSTVAAQISQKRNALVELISNAYAQSWYGYRSQTEQMLMLRMVQIADLFNRMASSINQVEEWTNFNEALVELAAIYALLIHRDEQRLGLLDPIFAVLAPKLVAPRLGSVVMQSVQQIRFKKVIERYTTAHGNDEIAQGLQALYSEGLKSVQIIENFSSGALAKIAETAKKLGAEPDFFLREICESLASGEIADWARKYDLPAPALAIDHPDLLGNDPQVDITARMLLSAIAIQVVLYPPAQWKQLTDVCVTLIQIVQQIRDEPPLYTLAANETKQGQPGKGQQATEDDLQKDVFERLQLRYGRSVGYEIARIGGGRSDTGLKFQDCEFPIEIKAEYKTVERQHIHDNYIAQVDTYASVRDRIAFILILDLRDIHSGESLKKASRRRKNVQQTEEHFVERYSLYSLQESFWIDHLPIDPQIMSAKSNAVVIGLVPGNRSKPSSMTKYSRKPSEK
jgi:hypothetical protein